MLCALVASKRMRVGLGVLLCLICGSTAFAADTIAPAPPPPDYASTIPHTTRMNYQLRFAIITPGLICGAYAERMKFSSMVIFSLLWLLLVYCPLDHMVWGKGGLFNWSLPPDGKWSNPSLDFAGGTVV